MKTFALSITTPEGSLYEGTCTQVTAPGSEGVFGVLAGHMNMVVRLKPGIVCIEDAAGGITKIAVADGIADIDNVACIFLVEKGMYLADADIEKIQSKQELNRHELLKADTEVLRNTLLAEKEFLEVILQNFNNNA